VIILAKKRKSSNPKFAKVNPYGLAGAFGILYGLYLAILALAVQAGTNMVWFNQATFAMVNSVYPGLGYAATTTGAFAGLLIGFVCGAICGLLIAWTYNWVCSIQK